MLLPPLTNGVFLFDNSSSELWQACPMNYHYAMARKRKPEALSNGLNFGTFAHEALAHRYKTWGNKRVDNNESMLAVAKTYFADHPETPGDHRNLSMAIAFIEAYNKFYPREDFNLLSTPEGKPFVEASFMHPFGVWNGKHIGLTDMANQPQKDQLAWAAQESKAGNIPIFYTGRIDLGISDSEGRWVVDHKSAYMFGSSNDAEVLIYPQMRGYCWAFRNLYGTLPMGYKINSFRVRPPTKDALLDSSLLFRRDDFKRTPVNVMPDEISEWISNTALILEELFWSYSNLNMPRRRRNCVGKFGPCAYYEICALPEHNRDNYLNSPMFVDNTWSPLNP